VRDQSFFYLGGLQFSVPIYAGNRNRLKIQQTQLDLKQTELTIQDSKNKLEVAVLQARIQTKTSYERYLSALKQEEAARQYFKLIDRGYREGVNSLIEWLDARNQQTQSALRKELDFFTHLQSLADLERQTAAFPLPKQ
jgi:outer membrane protein TolC